MNEPQCERVKYLYRIGFNILPDRRLSEDIMNAFDDEIERYYWVLTQEGLLIREEVSEVLLNVDYRFDLDDTETLISLQWLPIIKANTSRLASDFKYNFCAKVIGKVEDEFGRILGFDEDYVVFRGDQYALQDYHACWLKEKRNLIALERDTAQN